MAETERRHFPRHDEKAKIQILAISDYSKNGDKCCDLIPARLHNQSDEGLYFEIDRDLKPGSNVSIKMAAPLEQHPEDPYCVCDGLVIWSKKVDSKISRFRVGVKILRKVVQADVLNSRFG
jgi:hypothetical protein